MEEINTNTEELSTSLYILNVYLSCSLLLHVLLKQENYASASIGPGLSKLSYNTLLFLTAKIWDQIASTRKETSEKECSFSLWL